MWLPFLSRTNGILHGLKASKRPQYQTLFVTLFRVKSQFLKSLSFNTFSSFECSSIIPGHYFDFDYLNYGLNRDFYIYATISLKILTLHTHVHIIIIKLPPNQSLFLKLLISIARQFVKTEYFSCNFHFFVLNMKKWSLRCCLCDGFSTINMVYTRK